MLGDAPKLIPCVAGFMAPVTLRSQPYMQHGCNLSRMEWYSGHLFTTRNHAWLSTLLHHQIHQNSTGKVTGKRGQRQYKSIDADNSSSGSSGDSRNNNRKFSPCLV